MSLKWLSEEKEIEVLTKREMLSGEHLMLNLDQNSKLFVGGYPEEFLGPPSLSYDSFEGQIERVFISDSHVGLWNFVTMKNLNPLNESYDSF
jgi:laminin alpha 3/5